MATNLRQFVPDGRSQQVITPARVPPQKTGFFKGLVRGIKEAVIGPTGPVSPSRKGGPGDAFKKDGDYRNIACQNMETIRKGHRGAQPSGAVLVDYCSQVIKDLEKA